MFLDIGILFSLAMALVIVNASDFLFWDRSHRGDSGMNLWIRDQGSPNPSRPSHSKSRCSPVVGNEGQVGGGDGHLQPAPISDVVGEEGEDEEPHAEEHLVDHPHRAPELHADHLCDCRGEVQHW